MRESRTEEELRQADKCVAKVQQVRAGAPPPHTHTHGSLRPPGGCLAGGCRGRRQVRSHRLDRVDRDWGWGWGSAMDAPATAHALQIAQQLDAIMVFVENPATGLLASRDVIGFMPHRHRVDYCQYGTGYRRATAAGPGCMHDAAWPAPGVTGDQSQG